MIVHKEVAKTHPSDAVLVKLDIDSPETDMRKSRLRYFRRLVREASGVLWALLKLEDEREASSLALCRGDFKWLQKWRPDKMPAQDPME